MLKCTRIMAGEYEYGPVHIECWGREFWVLTVEAIPGESVYGARTPIDLERRNYTLSDAKKRVVDLLGKGVLKVKT